jgi:hypothetical protein
VFKPTISPTNSADEPKFQARTDNRKLQEQFMGLATPQILSDISTAMAILPRLRDRDVGIPQLIVLTDSALSINDLHGAAEFAARAVRKTDATNYLRAEADRNEGEVYFREGRVKSGRAAFGAALSILPPSLASASERAYVLASWSLAEAALGSCDVADQEAVAFVTSLGRPGVPPSARSQMSQTERAQLSPYAQRCPQLLSVIDHDDQ